MSLWSVLAGVFVAYGLVAVLAAVTAGVLRAVGVDAAALTSNDWRRLGIGSAIVAAVVLFISYFGGYVAGRMARRAGAVNGVLVFVLAVLVAIAAGVAIGAQADTEAVVSNLRSLGVPISSSEYGAIGTVAGLASLVAMLVGSILGGLSGERWTAIWPSGHTIRAWERSAGAEEAIDAEKRRADYEPQRPWTKRNDEQVGANVAEPAERDGSQSQRNAARRS